MTDLATEGGFLYWKYGDEFFSQKQRHRMENMAGTSTGENAHNGAASAIVLRSDDSFTFVQNSCEEIQDVSGTWSISDHSIEATSAQGVYILVIRSSNQSRYRRQMIYCVPYNKDIFTRGGTGGRTSQQKEKPQKREDIVGTYSGNHGTPVMSDIIDTTFSYTLTSLNPEDAQQVATISGIAQRNGNITPFGFSGYKYGTQGSGSFTLQDAQAVFSTQKTQADPQAAWGIFEEGTLFRWTVS